MPSYQSGKKAGNCVFVTNLSFSTTEDRLSTEFGRFGLLKGVVIVRSQKTGDSKGFAYITFVQSESAARAIHIMNNKAIDGRVIKVEESTTETRVLNNTPVKERPSRRILSPRRIDVPYQSYASREQIHRGPYGNSIRNPDSEPPYPHSREVYAEDIDYISNPNPKMDSYNYSREQYQYDNYSVGDHDTYSDYDYRPKEEFEYPVRPNVDPRREAYNKSNFDTTIPISSNPNYSIQDEILSIDERLPVRDAYDQSREEDNYDNIELPYNNEPHYNANRNRKKEFLTDSVERAHWRDTNSNQVIRGDQDPYRFGKKHDETNTKYFSNPESIRPYYEGNDQRPNLSEDSYLAINDREDFARIPPQPAPRSRIIPSSDTHQRQADPRLSRNIIRLREPLEYSDDSRAYEHDSLDTPGGYLQGETGNDRYYKTDSRLAPPTYVNQRKVPIQQYQAASSYANSRYDNYGYHRVQRQITVEPEKDKYDLPLVPVNRVEWPNDQPPDKQTDGLLFQSSTLRWKTNSDTNNNVSELIGSAKARLDSYKNLMNDNSNDVNSNANINSSNKKDSILPLNSNCEHKNLPLANNNLKNFDKDPSRIPNDRNIYLSS